MRYSSVVVSVLALSALAAAVPSIGDNSLDAGERVVLVSPVLAPPRDSRLHDTTRSRQFPILVLLAVRRQEPEAKSLKNPQPIYVQKLEDQDHPGLNRQKRGYGGGGHGYSGYSGGYGGGYGGGHGGYEEPFKTIIVEVVNEHGHGGGHHHGNGGYSGGIGGGGGYGGGGGSGGGSGYGGGGRGGGGSGGGYGGGFGFGGGGGYGVGRGGGSGGGYGSGGGSGGGYGGGGGNGGSGGGRKEPFRGGFGCSGNCLG